MVRILLKEKTPPDPRLEKKRERSRLYQRRRREALKLADEAEQKRIRERDQQYHAEYRRKNRWPRMMDERLRRNTEADRRRISKLRCPNDVTETARMLHGLWNQDIVSRRSELRGDGTPNERADEIEEDTDDGGNGVDDGAGVADKCQ